MIAITFNPNGIFRVYKIHSSHQKILKHLNRDRYFDNKLKCFMSKYFGIKVFAVAFISPNKLYKIWDAKNGWRHLKYPIDIKIKMDDKLFDKFKHGSKQENSSENF